MLYAFKTAVGTDQILQRPVKVLIVIDGKMSFMGSLWHLQSDFIVQ